METALLLDESRISQLVFRFAHAFDFQNWILMRSCLMDEIDVDYSDFRAQPPTFLNADDFVKERRASLTGIRTQHISANHVVTIDGDRASCKACAVIYRFDPNLPSENFFDTHCYYQYDLERTPDGWKISKIKQTVLWSTGNPQVHGFHKRCAPAADAAPRTND